MKLTKTVFQIIWDLETTAIKRRKMVLPPEWRHKYLLLSHIAAGWVGTGFTKLLCLNDMAQVLALYSNWCGGVLCSWLYLADQMMFGKAFGIRKLSVATVWIFYNNCSYEHLRCGKSVYVKVVLGSNSVGYLELCEFTPYFVSMKFMWNK